MGAYIDILAGALDHAGYIKVLHIHALTRRAVKPEHPSPDPRHTWAGFFFFFSLDYTGYNASTFGSAFGL